MSGDFDVSDNQGLISHWKEAVIMDRGLFILARSDSLKLKRKNTHSFSLHKTDRLEWCGLL